MGELQRPNTQQDAQQSSQVDAQHATVAMYDQNTVNSIVQGRINEVNAKNATQVSGLNAQISQLQEQNAALQAQASSYLTELTGLRNKATIKAAGIADQFASFAEFEISKLAVNGKSFEDATKDFVAANQAFLVSPNTGAQQSQQYAAQAPQATGASLQGSQHTISTIPAGGAPQTQDPMTSVVENFRKKKGYIK